MSRLATCGLTTAVRRTHWFVKFVLLVFVVSTVSPKFTTAGWLALAVLSLARIATHARAVRFPAYIYAPWVAYTVLRYDIGIPGGLQFIVQTLCPLLVGIAVSSTDLSGESAMCNLKLIRASFLVLLTNYAVRILPVTLQDVSFSGGATMSQSAMVLLSLMIALPVGKHRRATDIGLFAGALLMPALSGTRGPMVATLALLVTHPSWRSVKTRLLMGGLAAVVGLVFFHSEKVQKKSFVSGSGMLSDVRWDNPAFLRSGRVDIWEDLWIEGHNARIFGHGAYADGRFLLARGHPTALAHNDWLRYYFNYGIVGIVLFAATLAWQYFHALRCASTRPGLHAAYLCAGAACFVPMAVDMLAENIVITAQYFGALQYLLLGLGYAACTGARTTLATKVEAASSVVWHTQQERGLRRDPPTVNRGRLGRARCPPPLARPLACSEL